MAQKRCPISTWPLNCISLTKPYMKTKILLLSCIAGLAITYACDNAEGRYVDLNNNETVKLKKDESSGLMVREDNGERVNMYIDTETNDTIDGRTGNVVNGKIRKNNSGNWVMITHERENDHEINMKADMHEEGEAYKIKRGDYKKKVEKDGDIKIKDGNMKIKIDGETGEKKIKYD